jgi:SAM-dependent methyltransferase
MLKLRTVALAASLASASLSAQAPDRAQTTQERAQAALDAPKLASVLELQPGMTVADVGAGFGEMSAALARALGSGRVFATDIGQRQLDVIRDLVKTERLENVTVIEGGAASTNLPDNCCDAIFLRHVYHHITDVGPFNRSLFAAVKPGGRLAVIDFPPRTGSELPAGVPANRGGHGIPADIVAGELAAAGFTPVETIAKWPPDDKSPVYFLVLMRKPD